MKSVEERLRSYEPLWENWVYTGEFLGEGAMSSVFEIKSSAMGLEEYAALKIISVHKDARGEIKIPDNALNEIKILSALSGCSNIVNYHGSTQRKIYDESNELCGIDILIKMEKLRPLNEGNKLNEKEVIKLGKDMCTALNYASNHGVIHRDIKPQNMFVDNDGIYKLGDFGISKIVSEFVRSYTMNIGTMAYAAPEMCGSRVSSYDISSDIYSLGLVMYVFLNNGYLPFVKDAVSIQDAIAKRLAGAPFPSPANGSKTLKSIVMRACSASPANRFKTPQEMLDALGELTADGKKFIPDPFSTLDANIGISFDYDKINRTDTSAKYVKKSGGLRINMKKTSARSKSEDAKTKIVPSPIPDRLSVDKPFTEKERKDISGKKTIFKDEGLSSDKESSKLTSSRVRISKMGTKPSVKDKEETKETKESFFKTPNSL